MKCNCSNKPDGIQQHVACTNWMQLLDRNNLLMRKLVLSLKTNSEYFREV